MALFELQLDALKAGALVNQIRFDFIAHAPPGQQVQILVTKNSVRTASGGSDEAASVELTRGSALFVGPVE